MGPGHPSVDSSASGPEFPCDSPLLPTNSRPVPTPKRFGLPILGWVSTGRTAGCGSADAGLGPLLQGLGDLAGLQLPQEQALAVGQLQELGR